METEEPATNAATFVLTLSQQERDQIIECIWDPAAASPDVSAKGAKHHRARGQKKLLLKRVIALQAVSSGSPAPHEAMTLVRRLATSEIPIDLEDDDEVSDLEGDTAYSSAIELYYLIQEARTLCKSST